MARPGRPKNLYLVTDTDGCNYIIELGNFFLDYRAGRKGDKIKSRDIEIGKRWGDGLNLLGRLIAGDKDYDDFGLLNSATFKKIESLTVNRLPLYIGMKFKSIFFEKLLKDDF